MSELWYFNDVNLFDVMCPHKVGNFGGQGHFKEYQKGENIYFTDDPASTMYLIASGKVRILNYTDDGEEVVKAILGRGEMFGELALLGQEQRTDIAEAMDKGTLVCPVKIEMVKELMKDDQEFSFKIYKWLGWRMKKMERKIDNLIFKDVRARLVDFIHELATEKGRRAGDSVQVEHFFTHKNIANLIGTSRQTVTTTLNELRDEGVLDFDRRHFYIKNIQALRA